MPKIIFGITGLYEILGRDHGIEEPYWGPSFQAYLCAKWVVQICFYFLSLLSSNVQVHAVYLTGIIFSELK